MRDTPFKTEDITDQGVTVRLSYYTDYDNEPPWEDSYGHGPVRDVPTRQLRNNETVKRPGERVLYTDYRNDVAYLYDYQAAMKEAKKDGWNTPPYDAPNKAERAVTADMGFLRGFLAEDWHYVTVQAEVIGESFDVDEQYVGGFESLNNYHEEGGKDMAHEMIAAVVTEREERAYWASRDIVTA